MNLFSRQYTQYNILLKNGQVLYITVINVRVLLLLLCNSNAAVIPKFKSTTIKSKFYLHSQNHLGSLIVVMQEERIASIIKGINECQNSHQNA